MHRLAAAAACWQHISMPSEVEPKGKLDLREMKERKEKTTPLDVEYREA